MWILLLHEDFINTLALKNSCNAEKSVSQQVNEIHSFAVPSKNLKPSIAASLERFREQSL